jgi:hypothetical protein
MSQICDELHHLFHKLPMHSFPFDSEKIPLNGIYILFETDERSHNTDRIVRIGTHTGDKQLRSRLHQHFIMENKDRSIFRKNIGRALLNKAQDPFLTQWEIDLTTREAKTRNAQKIDFGKQRSVEQQVTAYIQHNFRFVVFCVDAKATRLELESKIISTVSLCDECGPSQAWLGQHSPVPKIRQSGLWLVNELYKMPLSEQDLEELKIIVGAMSFAA